MFRTPLKNSKNVSKPFKSPFDSPAQNRDKTKLLKKENDAASSPLSTRTLGTKRILLLEDDEKNNVKKPKLMKCDDNEESKLTELNSTEIETLLPDKLTKKDLLMLKKKVFEVRQELDSLKSRERCAKKNNPGELKKSIDKWRTACQDALEIFCSELRKQNDQSYKIGDILRMLSIPETIVKYSEKDDSFI